MTKLQYIGKKGPFFLARRNLNRSYEVTGPGAVIDCDDTDARTLIEENPNMFAVVSVMQFTFPEPPGNVVIPPGAPADPLSVAAAKGMLGDLPEHYEDEPQVPLTGDGVEGTDDEPPAVAANDQGRPMLGLADLTDLTIAQILEYVADRKLNLQFASKTTKADMIKAIVEAQAGGYQG